MAKQVKKDSEKVMSSKRIKENTNKPIEKDGLVEITLLKGHGSDEKGAKLLRHPNTAAILVDKKIAKY